VPTAKQVVARHVGEASICLLAVTKYWYIASSYALC